MHVGYSVWDKPRARRLDKRLVRVRSACIAKRNTDVELNTECMKCNRIYRMRSHKGMPKRSVSNWLRRRMISELLWIWRIINLLRDCKLRVNVTISLQFQLLFELLSTVTWVFKYHAMRMGDFYSAFGQLQLLTAAWSHYRGLSKGLIEGTVRRGGSGENLTCLNKNLRCLQWNSLLQ